MAVGVAIAGVVIGLASLVVSLVLGNKAQDAINNIPAEAGSLGDFSVTQMKEGVVVPIIYGTQFVKGNLIFWKANTVNDEYYTFRMQQVIGMGKLTLFRVYSEGSPVENEAGFPQSQEQLSTAGYLSQWLIGRDLDRNVISLLNYYDGVSTSENADTYSYFNSSNVEKFKQTHDDGGDYFSKMKGIANIFTEWTSLPQGVTAIPTYNFIVHKMFTDDDNFPIGVGNLIGSGQIYDYADSVTGNNPAFIIYDLLTNQDYGLGISETKLNLLGFQEAAAYFLEKKYGLNFSIKSIVSVRDIISKIQLWVNCYLVKNENDEYTIKILRETDADNPAAVVTDEDIIDFTMRRKSWGETYNSFTGNYTDCFIEANIPLGDWQQRLLDMRITSDGSIRSVNVKNESNINFTGSIRHKVIDLTCFSSPINASARLQEIMLQESYPFATATMTTDLSFSYLKLGDVIRRDSDEYNISGLFRVIDVGISEIDSNKLKYSLVQVRELLSVSTPEQLGSTRGITTNSELPVGIENVIFPRFSNLSEPLQMSISNKNNLIAAWGSGQFQSGYLLYGTDFTIDNENRVVLDPVIFADDILNNTAGLMNIDIYEKDLPEES